MQSSFVTGTRKLTFCITVPRRQWENVPVQVRTSQTSETILHTRKNYKKSYVIRKNNNKNILSCYFRQGEESSVRWYKRLQFDSQMESLQRIHQRAHALPVQYGTKNVLGHCVWKIYLAISCSKLSISMYRHSLDRQWKFKLLTTVSFLYSFNIYFHIYRVQDLDRVTWDFVLQLPVHHWTVPFRMIVSRRLL